MNVLRFAPLTGYYGESLMGVMVDQRVLRYVRRSFCSELDWCLRMRETERDRRREREYYVVLASKLQFPSNYLKV